MDTKWKSIRNILSFLLFFLGVSLTLWNLSGLARRLPARVSSRGAAGLLEEDYQQDRDFRQFISIRLQNFLSIAVNGCPTRWGYDGVYSDEVTEYWNILEWITEYGELQLEQGGPLLSQELQEGYGEYSGWPEQYTSGQEPERLSEEQKERLARWKKELTYAYFAGMEEDKNLLYNISYDGKLLYANGYLLGTDGKVHVPEGYNFLLFFDGEKVRITKDGEEVDVYGDGYYREKNDWYVPGYRNVPASEEMKQVVICMAAAKEPVLYTAGMDKSGEYRQQESPLYWMCYHAAAKRSLICRNLVGLAVGLGLLLLSCFCRKGRREAVGRLAALQGRMWVECKVLLMAVLLFAGVKDFFVNGGGMALREASLVVGDSGWETASTGALTVGPDVLLSDLRYVPAWFWVTLFWMVYLTVNDLKHNGKVWRHGLIAGCCRTFSARELQQPLARRMVHRNAFLFGALTLCGILMLAGMVWQAPVLCYLAVCCLLPTAWFVGRKNVGTAREVDALAERIGEICGGNYGGRDEGAAGATGNACGSVGNAAGSAGSGAESAGEAAGSAGSGAESAGEAAGGAGSGAESAGDGSGSAGNAAEAAGEAGASAGRTSRRKPETAGGRELAAVMAELENIRQGMAGAVEEQMKSQRMKVELIANVSHDLKTPLTSIISYVQFLKEEEGLPEHVKDYVRILDEKSQRLKNMVQDVFAVSKAASGELPMHVEELDFGKLLRQTLADMDEDIRNSKVSFRTELPEEPVMIKADGQRMYRVFQNLFQNALKYSLDGSRVYVALKTDGKTAVASVKNTSHMELKKDRDFTERFVRGDKSRTDGGSGLGLSIAQSFTEACGGQFELEFNADLFIARVSFQLSIV